MDFDDRSTTITIDGIDYPLLLTTYAVKKIAARYGGLEAMGAQLFEQADKSVGEVSYLVCLLANQAIARENLRNPNNTRPILTEEKFELLTTPLDLADMQDAILQAFLKGTKRNVENEEPIPKNT
jgi:hypothetical protein